MTFARVLHVAALFLMQGDFPGAGSETVTLKEGEDLSLRCTLSGDGSSARQWLNPHGFAIFLNTQRALRDQRYKLIHYSKDELSIQLSNVTVHDEGVYKCFYYSIPFKSKNKTLEVLAAPSNPVLEVSRDTERSITLSCYTQGCKPQPQITWLLDNGIELPGDSKHKLEADGKKWTTTSTLTVLAYGPNSTASCIVRHQALREEKLIATFQFEDLRRTVTNTNPAPAMLEMDTRVPENEQSTVTAAESDLSSGTAPTPSYPQHSGSKQPTIPSAVPEDPVVTSSASTPTQQNLQPNVTSTWSEVTSATAGKDELPGSSSYPIPNGTVTAFSGNLTEEELSRTEDPSTSENITVISIVTFEQDLKSERIKKENNLLLPILVAALIFALLIIVVLFMRKLKKAHGVWKRENDVSEQTLESYKSKFNEDSPGQEKNGHGVNQQSNVRYVTEGYVETTQKNPRDRNIAISEKLFGCGKETDV
ncbi:PREDICTED: cytotoxic and regulatory T-cell molecule [Chlamydotis macqueenii]|uniref:cytotoxic and regulatory T-cell molecule n=1 Tax=Chlamydotis macqueenii TaxID=187382 RepID=UPI00052A0E40|nr:PREDICTED: cytotoxic and regulatory T-cell molecule [Chlamydotis macqueenii]